MNPNRNNHTEFVWLGNIDKRFQFTWITGLVWTGLNCKCDRLHEFADASDPKKKTLSDSSSKKIGFDESQAGESIHWFHVDERPICVKQYAVSNISRFMRTGELLRNNFCPRVLSFFFSSIQIFYGINFTLGTKFYTNAIIFHPQLSFILGFLNTAFSNQGITFNSWESVFYGSSSIFYDIALTYKTT